MLVGPKDFIFGTFGGAGGIYLLSARCLGHPREGFEAQEVQQS